MTDASAPRVVWLLNGSSCPAAALVDALALRHPSVQWACLKHPPVEPHALTASVQARHGQLVLLVDDASTPTEAETRWRLWLQPRGWPHAVLPVPVVATLGPALDALLHRLTACSGLAPAAPQPPAGRPWQHWGTCEDCSDPACEHRLFQDLLARRSVQA